MFHQRVNLENFIGVKMYKMLNKISPPFTISFQEFMGIGVPEKNNSTSCLSFGPSTALHPPTRISICAAGCAL